MSKAKHQHFYNMNNLLKSLLLVALTIPNCAYAYNKGTMEFKGIIPQNGSVIEDFNFTYKFDITDVESKNPKYQWHTDWYTIPEINNNSNKGVELWEGDPGTGKLLYRLHEESQFGTDAEKGEENGYKTTYWPDGDVRIYFKSLVPKPGQKYTIRTNHEYIALSQYNDEKPYGGGGKVHVGGTSDPLIYTFIGGGTLPDNKCLYMGSDMDWAENLNEFSTITLNFNAPVEVVSTENVVFQKSKDESVNALSMTTNPGNPSSVTVTFPNTILTSDQYYNVYLPEGCIRNAINNESVNVQINHLIKGKRLRLTKENYELLTQGDIFGEIKIRLNLPEGVRLSGNSIITHQYYKGEDITAKPVKDYAQGSLSAEDNTMTLPLNFPYTPGEEYTVVIPSKTVRIDKSELYGYNIDIDEIKLTFRTPSVEDGKKLIPANVPDFQWGNAILGGYNYKSPSVLSSNDSLAAINPYIQIAPKGYKIKVDGDIWEIYVKNADNLIRLVEIDEQGNELRVVKTCEPTTQRNEDVTEYFNFAKANFGNLNLYDGKIYKMIIDEGTFTLCPKEKQYYGSYLTSPRYELTLKGSTSSTLPFDACNIEEGAQLSELRTIRIMYNGRAVFKDEKPDLYVAKITATGESKLSPTRVLCEQGPKYGTTLRPATNKTLVLIDYSSTFFDDSTPLQKGSQYRLTIPANTIVSPDDNEVGNPEFVLNITGVDKKNEEAIILHPVSIKIDNHTTTAFTAPENKELTLTLTPDDYWEIDTITDSGEDISGMFQNGKYTTTVTKPVSLEASLKYKGELFFTDTSGVAVIPDEGIKVWSENGNIIIDGLRGNEEIVIYTTSGIAIGKHTAVTDRLVIGADAPETYIIRIGESAVKILHR